MRVQLVLILVFATLALSPIHARQSSGLTGTWSVDAPETQSQSGDENWVLIALKGTLTLEEKSGAVTGTWKGVSPKPWQLTGHIEDKTFELQTEQRDLMTDRDGEKRAVSVHWTFRGTINGDKLSGSMFLQGENAAPSQAFTAERTR